MLLHVVNVIKIKLFGSIANDFGSRELPINLATEPVTLKSILQILKNKSSYYFNVYFDEDFSPKRGTIVLINGVDFNVIDGLETMISSTDQITLVPTVSGG